MISKTISQGLEHTHKMHKMQKTTPFVAGMQKIIPGVMSNDITDNFSRLGTHTEFRKYRKRPVAVEMQKNIPVVTSNVIRDNFTRFRIHTNYRKCSKRHHLLYKCSKPPHIYIYIY